MNKYYTCWGPVRQGCDTAHRTREAAEKCIEEDQKGCEGQGGHSDREVRVVESPRDVKSYDVTQGPGRRLENESSCGSRI